MANKEPQIVIKKVTVVSGGAHGGAWKVAFADFMTAMMCFFLVMWLTSQSEETKKNVSDYFSTPSVIEYNFSNFGVELTLEKLFLDLINEPLKFFQNFMSPMDTTPNIFDFGSQKIVIAHLAEQLGDLAQNVGVQSDVIEFEIPDHYLFLPGKSAPSGQQGEIMEKIKGIFRGLEDSNVEIESKVNYHSSMSKSPAEMKMVAEERKERLVSELEKNFEHESVDLIAEAKVIRVNVAPSPQGPTGAIVFRAKQKEVKSDGKKSKKLDVLFGTPDASNSAYDNFIKQIVEQKKIKVKK